MAEKNKQETDLAVINENKAMEVATQESSFDLPALTNQEEAMEIMADNLAELGGNLKFDKVKMPSGGGLSFEVINEDGEAEPVKEIIGVVLDHYPINAYWESEFTGEKNPPDCSSYDSQTGTIMMDGKEVGKRACADCPHNQWGTDPKGGKGKACKNMVRVYVLQEGCAFPILVTLPPTSTGNWRDYMKRLAGRMKSVYGTVTKIKLEKDQSKPNEDGKGGGITYSKAAFSKADELTREERMAIKAYAAQLRSSMRTVAIDGGEYAEDAEDNAVDTNPY